MDAIKEAKEHIDRAIANEPADVNYSAAMNAQIAIAYALLALVEQLDSITTATFNDMGRRVTALLVTDINS